MHYVPTEVQKKYQAFLQSPKGTQAIILKEIQKEKQTPVKKKIHRELVQKKKKNILSSWNAKEEVGNTSKMLNNREHERAEEKKVQLQRAVVS